MPVRRSDAQTQSRPSTADPRDRGQSIADAAPVTLGQGDSADVKEPLHQATVVVPERLEAVGVDREDTLGIGHQRRTDRHIGPLRDICRAHRGELEHREHLADAHASGLVNRHITGDDRRAHQTGKAMLHRAQGQLRDRVTYVPHRAPQGLDAQQIKVVAPPVQHGHITPGVHLDDPRPVSMLCAKRLFVREHTGGDQRPRESVRLDNSCVREDTPVHDDSQPSSFAARIIPTASSSAENASRIVFSCDAAVTRAPSIAPGTTPRDMPSAMLMSMWPNR